MVMADIDRKMAEADQGQEIPAESSEDAPMLEVVGVQLNEASRAVTIYHRETGEPRTMPRIAATVALRKKYRLPGDPLNGTFIFAPPDESGGRPAGLKKFLWGETKCTLHPDNPDREEYDKWGLPICTSEHLASPGEVHRHMRMRHPSADAIIREQTQERERKRDRETQMASTDAVREALERLAGTATPAAVDTVVTTPDAPIVEFGVNLMANTTSGSVLVTTEGTAFTWTCSKCDVVLLAESESKLVSKCAGHTRSKHPKRKRQAR